MYSSIMYTTDRPNLVFRSGKGSYLYDHNDKCYLDFVQGWAVNCLGHSPDVLNEALLAQANTLWNSSPAYYNEPQIRLADKLAAASGLEKIFFVSTGAEANEGVIKLARKWGEVNRSGAYKIITTQGGFHGRTLATMSATGKETFERLFNPKVEGFIKVPFNDIDAVMAAIDDKVVAVLLEPIQGEAGVVTATPTFLHALRKLCTDRGILLAFDEVQTGMGRTGRAFASDFYGVMPDIMTLGKGLGGGAPLAALMARASISCFETGEQGGTFTGNALMTAIGNAVFDIVIKDDFLANVRETSAYLTTKLETLFGVGSVRGAGLLLAVNLPRSNGKEWVEKAFEKGLLINSPNSACLRFMPALNVSRCEVDHMIEILTSIHAN